MANDILILKNKCDTARKDLSTISHNIISMCEKILDACLSKTNSFGEPNSEMAKSEIINISVKCIKEINTLLDSALECVNVIYRSMIKYNELGSTPIYKSSRDYSSEDIFAHSYFFSLANEIGNVFEDLYEKEVPKVLNEALNGLDIDNDGAQIKVSVITASIKKIAASVSKATKFYFSED